MGHPWHHDNNCRSMTCLAIIRPSRDTLMSFLDLIGFAFGFLTGVFMVFLLVLKGMAEGGGL